MTVDLFSTWHSFTCSRKKREKFHEFLPPNNSQDLNFSLEHQSSFQTHNSLLTDYHLVVLIGGGRGGGAEGEGFRAFATLKGYPVEGSVYLSNSITPVRSNGRRPTDPHLTTVLQSLDHKKPFINLTSFTFLK